MVGSEPEIDRESSEVCPIDGAGIEISLITYMFLRMRIDDDRC